MRRVKARTCPRCGDLMGPIPGALSRVDNKTEVCPPCGVSEAFEGMFSELSFDGWKSPPNKFDQDLHDLLEAEALAVKTCDHLEWRWLDCDECRETIGECGEKVCVSCGADVE